MVKGGGKTDRKVKDTMKKIIREGGGRKAVTYVRGNRSTTYYYKRGGLFGNYQYKGKKARS